MKEEEQKEQEVEEVLVDRASGDSEQHEGAACGALCNIKQNKPTALR